LGNALTRVRDDIVLGNMGTAQGNIVSTDPNKTEIDLPPSDSEDYSEASCDES